MKSDRPATIHTCSPTVKSVFSPVILVSLSVTAKTKLAACDHGVDGILTVPFSPEELGARVLAVMRRTYHETVVFTFSLPSRHISGPQPLLAAVCFGVFTRVYEFLHERLVQSSRLLQSFSMEVNQPLVGIDPDNQRGGRVIETLRQFIQWGA